MAVNSIYVSDQAGETPALTYGKEPPQPSPLFVEGDTPDVGYPAPQPPAQAPMEPVQPAAPERTTTGPASQLAVIQDIREKWLAANEGTLSAKALAAGLKQFDIRAAEVERAATLERMVADEELVAWVRDGNDPNAFPVSKRSSVSEAAWEAAGDLYFSQVNGTGRVTNPMIYNDLMERALRVDPRTRRLQILDVSLAEYAPQLSPEDYKTFSDMQRKAAAEAYNLQVEASRPVAITDATYGLLKTSVTEAVGRLYDPKSEEFGQVLFAMTRWAEAAASEPGRQGTLPMVEIRAKAREMVAQVALNPAGLGNQMTARAMEMDFNGRTSDEGDDFTVSRAYEAAENDGFTINGVPISSANIARAEARVREQFGFGLDEARFNQLVFGYLFSEYGDVYTGSR